MNFKSYLKSKSDSVIQKDKLENEEKSNCIFSKYQILNASDSLMDQVKEQLVTESDSGHYLKHIDYNSLVGKSPENLDYDIKTKICKDFCSQVNMKLGLACQCDRIMVYDLFFNAVISWDK